MPRRAPGRHGWPCVAARQDRRPSPPRPRSRRAVRPGASSPGQSSRRRGPVGHQHDTITRRRHRCLTSRPHGLRRLRRPARPPPQRRDCCRGPDDEAGSDARHAPRSCPRRSGRTCLVGSPGRHASGARRRGCRDRERAHRQREVRELQRNTRRESCRVCWTGGRAKICHRDPPPRQQRDRQAWPHDAVDAPWRPAWLPRSRSPRCQGLAAPPAWPTCSVSRRDRQRWRTTARHDRSVGLPAAARDQGRRWRRGTGRAATGATFCWRSPERCLPVRVAEHPSVRFFPTCKAPLAS